MDQKQIGLRQFHVRGLVKVQIEMLWACLTYNLQHWIRLRKLEAAASWKERKNKPQTRVASLAHHRSRNLPQRHYLLKNHILYHSHLIQLPEAAHQCPTHPNPT